MANKLRCLREILKGKPLGNEEGSTACLGAKLTAKFGAGTVRV